MDAGHFAVVSAGKLEVRPYWTLTEQVESAPLGDFASAKAKLKELVESSLRYRMIGDVPFGTFLSGGIDSSIVTAVAQSLSTQPVKTFTIAFGGSGLQ